MPPLNAYASFCPVATVLKSSTQSSLCLSISSRAQQKGEEMFAREPCFVVCTRRDYITKAASSNSDCVCVCVRASVTQRQK